MSNLTEYDINDTVRLSCSFTLGGVLTNPTTAAVFVTKSDASSTNYASPTNDSVGAYHQDVVVTIAGEWIAIWTGTGTVAAVSTQRFAVRRSGA